MFEFSALFSIKTACDPEKRSNANWFVTSLKAKDFRGLAVSTLEKGKPDETLTISCYFDTDVHHKGVAAIHNMVFLAVQKMGKGVLSLDKVTFSTDGLSFLKNVKPTKLFTFTKKGQPPVNVVWHNRIQALASVPDGYGFASEKPLEQVVLAFACTPLKQEE